jgi:hypothetical protein
MNTQLLVKAENYYGQLKQYLEKKNYPKIIEESDQKNIIMSGNIVILSIK